MAWPDSEAGQGEARFSGVSPMLVRDPAGVTEALSFLDAGDRLPGLTPLPRHPAAQALLHCTPELGESLLRDSRALRLAEVLDCLAADGAAVLFEHLPHRTVARSILWNVARLDPETSARGALQRLRGTDVDPRALLQLYVVDADGCLKGSVGLRRLLLADPGTVLRDLRIEGIAHVHADFDQEQVANIFGGNTGLQSATIIVRGLSTGHIQISEWRHVVLRQVTTTLILGAACGVVLGLIGLIWSRKLSFALVVTIGMFLSVHIAVVVGTVGRPSGWQAHPPSLRNSSAGPATATACTIWRDHR